MGPDEVIRCWKLQTRFDCLYAEVFDIRERIADAPVQRSYYRFLTSRLPVRKSQLDELDTSDGYECSVSSTNDRSTMMETVWKNGRMVAQSSGAGSDTTAPQWDPQEILAQFKVHAINPRRPYFSCPMVDEIVTKMGLDSLDSPLVTYEALVQPDRLAHASASGDGADLAADSQAQITSSAIR